MMGNLRRSFLRLHVGGLATAALGILAAAVLTACGGGGGVAPPPTSSPIAAPPNGAFLGAFINTSAGAPFAQQIAAFEQGLAAVSNVNHALATHLHFYSGNPASSNSITTVASDPSVADDFSNGRIPVLTWTCADKLSTIASGADDGRLIVPVAQAIKQLPGRVMLRWFHEFELNLTDGLSSSGTGTPNGQYQYCFDAYNPSQPLAQNLPAEAQEFVAAWQHIRQVFAQQGVTNVTWVWNPGGAAGAVQNDSLMSFFPGMGYVDWIGGDFYDKPSGSCNGFGLVAIVSPFYAMVQGAGVPLPIIMTETGEDVSHTGCTTGTNWSQQRYFQDMASDLPTQFPQIKAVEYFDSQGNAPYDWTLTPGSAGFDGYAALEANPYFVLSSCPAAGTGTCAGSP